LVLKSKTVWKPAIINELIGLAMCLAVGNTFVFYQNLELFLFNFLFLVKNTLLQTDFSAILLTKVMILIGLEKKNFTMKVLVTQAN